MGTMTILRAFPHDVSARLHHLTRFPAARTLLLCGWTLWVLYLLLAPGEGSVASDLSVAAGDTPSTDSAGHTLLFALTTGVWYWALRLRQSARAALTVAVVTAVLIGTLGEWAQQGVAFRTATPDDALANTLGVLAFACAWACYRALRRRALT